MVNPITWPEITLDGEFLATLFLGALALLIFAVYAITHQIWLGLRPHVAGITIVGGALAGAGDSIVSALRNTARGLATACLWLIVQMLNTLHKIQQLFTAIFVNPVIAAHNALFSEHSALNSHVKGWTDTTTWDAYVTAHRNGTTIDNELRPNIARAQGTADWSQAAIKGEVRPRLATAQATADAAAAHGNRLDDRLSRLEATLAPVLPVARPLGQIGSWPLDMPGRTRALEGDVTDLRTRLGVTNADLAKVLPLSVIVALGAVAVDTLFRIAKDPCEITQLCQLLTDLPDRVEALENFGP